MALLWLIRFWTPCRIFGELNGIKSHVSCLFKVPTQTKAKSLKRGSRKEATQCRSVSSQSVRQDLIAWVRIVATSFTAGFCTPAPDSIFCNKKASIGSTIERLGWHSWLKSFVASTKGSNREALALQFCC